MNGYQSSDRQVVELAPPPRGVAPGVCTRALESTLTPGHTHTCGGVHMDELHKCDDPTCRRWFTGTAR